MNTQKFINNIYEHVISENWWKKNEGHPYTYIMIAATSPSGVIGKNGTLPWKSRDDMHLFKELTTGHTVVMGRKTFESIGKPLPNRFNIVISSKYDNKLEAPNLYYLKSDGNNIISDIERVMSFNKYNSGIIYIAGGSALYSAFADKADLLIKTQIPYDGDGDVFFPTAVIDNFASTSVYTINDISCSVYRRRQPVVSNIK